MEGINRTQGQQKQHVVVGLEIKNMMKAQLDVGREYGRQNRVRYDNRKIRKQIKSLPIELQQQDNCWRLTAARDGAGGFCKAGNTTWSSACTARLRNAPFLEAYTTLIANLGL